MPYGTGLKKKTDNQYLQNKNTFLRFLYKNSYLLVIAAWLITISFIIDNYWSDNSSAQAVQKNIASYIHEQEHDFNSISSDTAFLNRLILKKYDEAYLNSLTQKKYFFYLYQLNEAGEYNPVFWSTQAVLPSSEILHGTDSTGFVLLPNGYYVWRKSNIGSGTIVALIPVKWNYVISNEYLKNTFVIGQSIENNYDVSLEPSGVAVKSVNGTELFYLIKKAGTIIPKNNTLSVWLRISAIVFILLFLHFCALYISMHNRLWKAMLFLVVIVTGLRVLSYYFPVPLNFRQFELFDPAIYGSSVVLRSLGDLLINAILFVWLILFLRQQLQEKKYTLAKKGQLIKWLSLILAAIVLLTATFVCGHTIRSMVADSQISFDVINFFTLNAYSIIGFVVLCCIAIGYFLLGQILLFLLKPMFPKNFIPLYGIVAVAGLIVLTIGFNMGSISFYLYLLIWLLVFLFFQSSAYFSPSANGISSSKFVFWLFFFSVSITMVIVQENNIKELRNRKHYAETLSTKADPASETLMNTLLTDFRSETLAANFEKFRNDSTNQLYKDSLVNGNFSGYTNKYETKVFSFDENEKPLFNRDSTTYNELNTILNTQGRPTGIADLYYYDESYDRFSYISKKNVVDTGGKTLGYVYILAHPKKYKSDALCFCHTHYTAADS